MTNLDNNFNVNNNRTYAPNLKKAEDSKAEIKTEEVLPEVVLEDGTKAADSYGRILVKPAKIDNTTPVQSIVDSLDYLMENYDTALAAMKASDDAYELMLADGVDDAYEKSCCGAIDAAYSRVK